MLGCVGMTPTWWWDRVRLVLADWSCCRWSYTECVVQEAGLDSQARALSGFPPCAGPAGNPAQVALGALIDTLLASVYS